MSDIDVEQAVADAQGREEAVRLSSVVFDKELAILRELYSLPPDGNQWASAFASRLASRNKEYRLRVKQKLQASAHNLKYLHTEGGEGDTNERSDAMRVIVLLVVGALKSTRHLKAQVDEYVERHRALVEAGNISLPDRVFIRRSLPDLRLCLARLERDSEQIRDEFKEFKQSFYVIAFECELKRCQDTLSARKTTREAVEARVAPTFMLLVNLLVQRGVIIEESAQLGIQQATAWFTLPTGRVALDEYTCELARYDPLISRVNNHKMPHDGAIKLIHEVEDAYLAAPLTLPGPDGQEIPVETLCGAFEAYERIRATCMTMLELAKPITETLDSYLKVLRKADSTLDN